MMNAVTVQLRDVLVALYPEVADLRRVAYEAGIAVERVALGGSAVNDWAGVVAEAVKNGQVADLLDVARQEYGGSAALAVVTAAFVAAQAARTHALLPDQGLVLLNFGRELTAAQQQQIKQHLGERVHEVIALATRFDGKRFNSPNDLALRRNGDIYFTDPSYGLEKGNDSPLKELPFNGVYRLTPDGKVTLLTKSINFPNGIAFSPDEKVLYVAVSDGKAPRIMAYDVTADGGIAGERVFFDALALKTAGGKGSCDGLKIDRAGNLWATGPGGVLVISPSGKHLGTLATGVSTANCGWGDDGSTLYITANNMLLRVKTKTKGAGW